jgi:hypothetical protein
MVCVLLAMRWKLTPWLIASDCSDKLWNSRQTHEITSAEMLLSAVAGNNSPPDFDQVEMFARSPRTNTG